MFSSDDATANEMFNEAIDSLDVRYIEGSAYMSIHTVDAINESLLSVIDLAIEAGIAAEEGHGEEIMSKEMVQGALWVMTVWKHLHDELDVRAEAKSLPDTPESLVDEEN
jgi:hypothetical protein